MKKFIVAAAFVIVAAAAGVAGFFIGRGGADAEGGQIPESQTFYAAVEEINGASFLVEGLSVNDINFRGAFEFTVDENTVLQWRYTPLEATQLEPGDNISITFTGEILETYPGQIRDVIKIQLLDDEL